MENFLNKLRQKPEAYRMRIAFTISASVAGIIFLVWLSVLGVKFKNNESTATAENSEPAFAEFREEFAGAYEMGKAQFKEAEEELKNIVQ
ncbi:MAG: hypothetical protein QGG63_02040 [Candidatus Pacebacteria bacterium]|jgi:uncharacterized membrane protein|nr:hypothetical protein [Candidatus Paceibacterota bacterium]|tara:strand:+ start:20142 stop:20411 length:270 start_codon:yes stop_codon:yes gene_type:complete